MTIEHALICTIIASQDYGEVMAAGVKPSFFYDTQHKRVFELIGEHLLEYRRVPGQDAVLRAFPNYEFTEYPETVSYYSYWVRDSHIKQIIMNGLTEKVQPLINDPTLDGARLVEVLGKVIYEATVEAPTGVPIDSSEYILGYMEEEVKLRAVHGYLRGIGTGFQTIDRAIGGYQPEQLVTFVGLPKHGKSTMMLAAALEAKRQGYRVLFITFEMSVNEQMDRLSSLISGLSLSKIQSGEFTYNEEQEFFLALRKFQSLVGLKMVHDRNSVLNLTGVNSVVMDNDPDIVFIDGMYFMDDEQGEPAGSPRALTNLTRGMKRLAQGHKIPFVVSTQALHSRSRGGLRADSVGYSSSFVQDSDVTVGVYKLTSTLSQFKSLAVRSGQSFDEYVRIDWNQGLIEEVDAAVAKAEIDDRGSGSATNNWAP